MPLSRLDEYLTHQFPEPIDTVYTADRNFYDRYYFNLHGPGDELFLVAGLGQYPNLGVTDAFVTVAHDDVQTTVRASRELGSDRLDTGVGPLRVEVIEGLRSLRLVCEPNEWGVAYDLRFDATTEALAEPKTISRAGTRVTQDTFRYAQVGAWSGTLEVSGTTHDVTPDTWRGARDRSWGIRPIGEPEPKGIQAKFDPSGSMGFLHNWLPIQFDDHMIKITIDNDHAGRRVQEEAMLLWSLGSDRPDEHLGRPEIDIEYHPGTREVRQGTIWFSGDGASPLRITATPLRTVYLKSGSGYHWDGAWGHGVWQGAETKVEGLVDPIGAPTERHHLAWLNETLSRFETNDGRVGHGMWENLCMGLYLPAGFDRPDAVAP